MNNECGHWLNSARHTRCPNERTMEMASGAMLWHIPRVQISQQWLWPLRRSSGTAQKDNNRDVLNALQQCGHGERMLTTSALFLMLYEPWVKNTDISSLEKELNDPDQPLQTLTKTSKKPERTRVAMYQLMQSSDCICHFFAKYLCDDAPTTLDFTNKFCCDRHSDGFNLADFFPGGSQVL